MMTFVATPALPSAWLDTYRSESDWVRLSDERAAWSEVTRSIDDAMLHRRSGNGTVAWCAVCDGRREMVTRWTPGGISAAGVVEPDWDEITRCTSCGLSGRVRALVQFALDHPSTPAGRVSVQGTDTNACRLLSARLVNDATDTMRSETALLADRLVAADLVTTLRAMADVVHPSTGRVLFTMPTREVAMHEHAGVAWRAPAEDASLGFSTMVAHQYWAPWFGHHGGPSFVFEARR